MLSEMIKQATVSLALAVLFCMLPGSLYADQTYAAGTVKEISYSAIKIGEETYKVNPKARVILQEKRGPGITERRGSRSDVQPDSAVTVQLTSGEVTLIYVELYH